MCKVQRLDQFRVCFDLYKSMQHEIDKCIKFVFSRNVQRLELDLSKGDELMIHNSANCCTFIACLLGLGDSPDSFSCIPHSNDLQILSLVELNFKSLKVLLFKSVNVTGKAFHYSLISSSQNNRETYIQNLFNVQLHNSFGTLKTHNESMNTISTIYEQNNIKMNQ